MVLHFWKRGRVRLIAAVLKTVEGKTSVGSNPTASATKSNKIAMELVELRTNVALSMHGRNVWADEDLSIVFRGIVE